MRRAVPTSNYVKRECPTCGREVIATARQRNFQCQRCYNATHKRKVYWKEGGDKYESENNRQSEQD